MLIRVNNNLTNYSEYTYLTNDVSAGTSLPVKNINPFSAQWAVQIGGVGEEQSEIAVLTSGAPSGTAINLSGTTRYEHPADTPVYAIKYDQIVFMRSTAGTAGTATALATVTITPDSLFTQYDDTTGASTYAYKSKFRNSALAVESTESDWITPSGYEFYSNYTIKQRIRDKLWSSDFIRNDEILGRWVNEWLEKMTNAAIKVKQDYALGTTVIAYSAGQELGTISAQDFKKARRVWFADASGTVESIKMPVNAYDPNDVFDTNRARHYWQGDTVLGRKPSDSAGTAVIVYAKLNPVLENDSDLLPLPMRSYTKSFVDYGLSQALWLDQKPNESKLKEDEAKNGLQDFVSEISPRDDSSNEQIQIVEPIGGEDWMW